MKYFYIISIFLVFSCKPDVKKDPVSKIQITKPIIEELISPAQGNSSLPKLYSNGKEIFLSWVEKKDSISSLQYSVLKNDTWSSSEEIINGKDWFVNWADFPAITENDGNILTNFLQKSADGTYTYDVKLNLFSSETKTWNNNILLNTDGTKSEHGFVSMLPFKNDSFFVTWLDGRTTVNVERENAQMTLRSAIVNKKGEILEDILMDERVCDCCQTSAAITNNGPIVVYRDRSSEEVRDISIVRFENGDWTKPQAIYEDQWVMPGCPVNGPSVDALGDNLAVAWFTAENDNPRVQAIFSEDNGKTFGLPIRIDSGNAIGRVDVTMISENKAIICWMEPQGNDTL
ncbi:MAG: hypothetical protein KUG68_01675, partial [Flavobacteriaceae bacterium]|nr:hypothetical protein [Flavobacteriaceae bacterium]